jgi:N-acylneuraminate cytidylyltransferase
MKLCVIPARGGSKRIPRKNIRNFLGKPIIAYSIEAAYQSGCFDRVIVSTDDLEIATVSRQYGAETPFTRPAELANDFADTNAVVKHALAWYLERGMAFDYACCIYATAPFIKPFYLKIGYEKIENSGKQFAFSVTTYDFPIQRAIRISPEFGVEPFYSEFSNSRSQDLEEAYHDAGQFYWGTAQAYLEDKHLFSELSTPVILPRYMVQDIDTLEDWKTAELMYQVSKVLESENA